jgi:hypothetical protein
MSEFTFDGVRPDIRKILDDSFRIGNPKYDDTEFGRFIKPLHFKRDMTDNLIVFRKLIDAVMVKEEFKSERSKSDGWLAPRIHNALRLTRREAACKEFWIGLIFQNLDYVWWRFEVTSNSPIGLDRIVGSDSRMAFAQIWWAAEQLQYDSDYSLASMSANSSDLGMYYQSLDNFHSKPIAISLCNWSFRIKQTHDLNKSLARKLNFCINCFVRDDIAASTGPDIKALRDWIQKKPDLKRLQLDELPQGRSDSPIPKVDLDRMIKFIEYIATDGNDASKSGEGQ